MSESGEAAPPNESARADAEASLAGQSPPAEPASPAEPAALHQPPAPAARRRPFGVYVIIGLQLLIVLSNWLDVVRVQLNLSPLMLPDLPDEALTEALSIGITVLVIVVAVGLWALKRWAWFATMLMQGAALLYGIWQYFNGGEPYLSLLLNALVVFYLNQGDVQRCFVRPPTPEPMGPPPSAPAAPAGPAPTADPTSTASAQSTQT